MRCLRLGAVFVIVAGLGGFTPETDGSDKDMPDVDRAKLLEALDAELLDGKSVRIKDIRRVRDERRYCGYLNAKNNAGAYSGWQLFSFNATLDDLGMQERGVLGLDTNACAWTKHYRGGPL